MTLYTTVADSLKATPITGIHHQNYCYMSKNSIFAHSRQAFGPPPRPPAQLTIPVSQCAPLTPAQMPFLLIFDGGFGDHPPAFNKSPFSLFLT